MKYIDIKEKSKEDLIKLLKEKRILLFELKLKLKTMQLQNTSELRVVKKDIAKIQTAIGASNLNDTKEKLASPQGDKK